MNMAKALVLGLLVAAGMLIGPGCEREAKQTLKKPGLIYASDIPDPEEYEISLNVAGTTKKIKTKYWEFYSDEDPKGKSTPVVYRIVAGSIGDKGITPPKAADGVDADLAEVTRPKKDDGTSENAAVLINSGWAFVTAKEVNDGTAAGAKEKERIKALIRAQANLRPAWATPWRLLLLRGMATGAYGSSYATSSTPKANHHDGHRQTVYSRSGKVVFDKRDKEQEYQPLARSKESTLKPCDEHGNNCGELGDKVDTDAADKDAFLKEAEDAYDKTKAEHDKPK